MKIAFINFHSKTTVIPALLLALAVARIHAAEPPGEWKLVWQDEFDGTNIDQTKWDFDHGNGFIAADGTTFISGWGNGELENYTDRPENAFVKDGLLHIQAVKSSDYTSARLKSRKSDKSPLFNKLYGRFEFRAKLPVGKGLWPAIWLLSQDEKFGGWAASGEVDIMEARGQETGKVLGTLHYGGGWPANAHTGKDFIFPGQGSIADFHVYALEWEPGEMRWYVDGKLYQTQNFWWSTSKRDGAKGGRPANESELNPWPAPFNQPFYIVLNLAIGGQFLGNPDATTVFPAEMDIDYVRVYDKVGGYQEAKPRGEGKLPF